MGRSCGLHVILFAKATVPGQVKTRLIPYLGAERACALHMHLVRRAIEPVKGSRIKHIELWCAPEVDHPFFMACRDRYGVSLHRQRGIDLGSRMAGALSKVLERARSALLIGSDCPALSADDLDACARVLSEGYDAVLGPAADGGYVLIGLKRVAPELYRDPLGERAGRRHDAQPDEGLGPALLGASGTPGRRSPG